MLRGIQINIRQENEHRICQCGDPQWFGRDCLSLTEAVTRGGDGLTGKAPGKVLGLGVCWSLFAFSFIFEKSVVKQVQSLIFLFQY